MSGSDTTTSTGGAFLVPGEPAPLPSLSSEDEESFVVLGKSLIPSDDTPPETMTPTFNSSEKKLCDSVVGSEVVEEAKAWIRSDIEALEREENGEGAPSMKSDEADGKLLKRSGNSPEFLLGSSLEQSTALPEMPKVENGFEANTISISMITSNLSSEEVQNKVAQIIEENIKLKDTILQNNISMQSQYDRIIAWEEEVKKVHQAHKDKIYEAKACIEKLKKDKESIMHELDKQKDMLQAKTKECDALQEVINSKQSDKNLNQSINSNLEKFQLEAANKKIKELEDENLKLKNEVQELIKSVDRHKEASKEAHDMVTLYEGHVKELSAAKAETEQLKLEIASQKNLLRERETELGQMIADLRQQLVQYKKQESDSAEELTNARTQLASTQVMLTEAEQRRAAACSQVNDLNQQISQLTKEIEELKAKDTLSDEMFALKTQLDVYKADFEAELGAKETIKAEKDKLLEDIQSLQTRNQQLQNEIEVIRNETGFVVCPRPGTTTSPDSGTSNSWPMKCPKCSFGFSTLRELEDHVYRCIELDDQIP